MLLEDAARGRNNNLNIIRFSAAVLVIYCHAYPLGNGSLDVLGRATENQMHFGNLAVCVFFFFGGFLISRSTEGSKNGLIFFKARCVRIFPCLALVVCLSAFVLGSCMSIYPPMEYFKNIQTYQYLLNTFFILKHNLPGVFEQNMLSTVNGSLWTLPVEFLCYIVCWCVYRTGWLREKRFRYTIPLFFAGYICLRFLFRELELLQTALRPCGMFYMGMAYYTYRSYIKLKYYYAGICIVGLVISSYIGALEYGVLLFLPYILVYIGFGMKGIGCQFGRNYELSYGMYLCAFPIQQTIVALFGGRMLPIWNFLFSVPFVLLAGFLLNIFVEKPLRRYLDSHG